MNTRWTLNIQARIGATCSTMYAGDTTHTVLISTLPPSPLSALFCGEELAHLLIWCCSFRQTCPWMRSTEPELEPLFSCRVTQHSLDALAAAWQAKLQVLRVCLCLCLRVRGAVWKAHVQHSESHYTMADCHGELKAGHKWRQRSENIVNATMVWSTVNETCRPLNRQNERNTEYS